MKKLMALIGALGLVACVSGGGGSASLLRPSSDTSAIAARAQIANRTFAASPGGPNLSGSIYFAADGTATQAAEGQGTERLAWTIELGVDGISGPAVCLAGRYFNIVTNPPAIDIQREGGRIRCAPVSDFAAVKSTVGNGYGLGTFIR
jgi:hypothetical protein